MSQRPSQIPELLLEQLLLGELSAEDERTLRTALGPEELERRLALLRSESADFHERVPPTEMVTSIQGRLRVERARKEQRAPGRSLDCSRARGRASTRLLVPSLAVLGCVALFVWRGETPAEVAPGVQQTGQSDTTRVKGLAPHLVLYRRRGSDVETLQDGARASRGDMLQVGYVAADARYGVIVSVDGRGAVTLHYPSEEYGTTLLEATGEHLLDHAYELDAAPAFERFFFVTDTRPVDVKRVLAAARTLARSSELSRRAPLALAPSLKQESLILVKE